MKVSYNHKRVAESAARYRFEKKKMTGVVLVNPDNFEAYGWRDTLRDPHTERPRMIAVDAQGLHYVASGGDDHSGAQAWERAMQ